MVGGGNRDDTRIGVVGVSPTYIPRCGLGHQPYICPNDNLCRNIAETFGTKLAKSVQNGTDLRAYKGVNKRNGCKKTVENKQ